MNGQELAVQNVPVELKKNQIFKLIFSNSRKEIKLAVDGTTLEHGFKFDEYVPFNLHAGVSMEGATEICLIN